MDISRSSCLTRDAKWESRHQRKIVRNFPKRTNFNTLGVAEYRAGNYETAIAACLKSVELTPAKMNLPSPYAGDFSFIGMSCFQLGNKDEAMKYRQQFTELP